MKPEELAFFNQQLAGMLRHGIPLEGALKELCRTLRAGSLKTEMVALASDLERGTPLPQALEARRLPDFYKQMLKVGGETGDLPALLTLIADHYHQASNLSLRLKGLMVYPMIVLMMALVVSVFLAVLLGNSAASSGFQNFYTEMRPGDIHGERINSQFIYIWFFPVLLAFVSVFCLACLAIPAVRNRLRWRLPGFRESSLARVANSLGLLLKGGAPLDQALRCLVNIEPASPAQREIVEWEKRLAAGHAGFEAMAADSRWFPPLFRWLVRNGGEDLAEGFRQAGDVYSNRATHRIDTLLQAALPVSVIVLGVMIMLQFGPMVRILVQVLEMLG